MFYEDRQYENMKYFSTFTGIGAFEQAVKNLITPYDKFRFECVGYSEIDPYAIQVFENNHPGHKNYGDIKEIKELPDFDLLVGGSPCQDLSIAKKGREGLAGSRSSLFWEFVRLLELKKPRYFLLENVASMKKEDRDTISRALGVEPVMINAALVTAQQRKRLFWCNWKVEQPENRHIYLKDILEDGTFTEREKSYALTATYHQTSVKRELKDYTKGCRQLVFETPDRIGQIGKGGQGQRIYSVNGKSVCLSALGGGWGAKTGLYLTTPPQKNLFNEVVDTTNLNVTLPGWDKSELKRAVDERLLVARTLTPIEVERLQGFPNGYTDCVSNTRRKMGLGNAFCVPVVEHIIKSLIK